jgi:hypothetical protein
MAAVAFDHKIDEYAYLIRILMQQLKYEKSKKKGMSIVYALNLVFCQTI